VRLVGIKSVSGDTTVGALNAVMLVTDQRKSKDKLNKHGKVLTMIIYAMELRPSQSVITIARPFYPFLFQSNSKEPKFMPNTKIASHIQRLFFHSNFKDTRHNTYIYYTYIANLKYLFVRGTW